ncbi:hypothetical protein BBJ28_00002906 [Nothophytophthora sp. Chile5]|nr:hypothetical protein BBJ28_00002906 [Nothophytophthora sp. Chile5]
MPTEPATNQVEEAKERPIKGEKQLKGLVDRSIIPRRFLLPPLLDMESSLSPVGLDSPPSTTIVKTSSSISEDGKWEIVEVEVPPGPLGILLDGDEDDRPVLEGYAAVSATDEQLRGAVERSGRVPAGSLLMSVNQYDFADSGIPFAEVGVVLRETSHLPRTLRFRVALSKPSLDENKPLSQQFAPRRGPPPIEVEEDESEDDSEAADAEYADSDADSDEASPDARGGSAVDNVVFESGSSSAGDSFREIDGSEVVAALAETTAQIPEPAATATDGGSDGQASSGGMSWTLTGSKTPSLKSPLASSSSSLSPEKPQQLSPENPQQLSPEKPQLPSPVLPSLSSKVSSGVVAASLMAQSNQLDSDESSEDEDAEYVTAVVSAGPLGLNLDGGVLDQAVVMGFAKLRDGAKGALERHGDIVPGSVIVRINGEDFSHATLEEVRSKLGELSQQTRTLVFRLPSKEQQQEEQQRASLLRATVIRRAATLPPFEEDLDKRRRLELALVMRFDKTMLARRECWFCLDAQWMARWVEFAARGGPLPGPITNETLLDPKWREVLASDAPGRPDTARKGLTLMKDYRVVAPMVWCLFAELHGLGEAPLLARYLMDIHAEPLSEAEVTAVLQVPRPKAMALANDLRDKCLVRTSDFS